MKNSQKHTFRVRRWVYFEGGGVYTEESRRCWPWLRGAETWRVSSRIL